MVTRPLPPDIPDPDEHPHPDDPSESTYERFVIDDDSKADWAVRKIAEAERRMAAVHERHDREQARIADWLTSATAADRQTVEHMTALLERYAIARREADGTKSIKTPHGTIQTRVSSPTCKVVGDKFVDWALGHGLNDLIRVKHEVDKRSLNERTGRWSVTPDGYYVTEDGEVVPDVEWVGEQVSVTVKPDLGGV